MENYDFKGNRIDYEKARLKAKKEVFDDVMEIPERTKADICFMVAIKRLRDKHLNTKSEN